VGITGSPSTMGGITP